MAGRTERSLLGDVDEGLEVLIVVHHVAVEFGVTAGVHDLDLVPAQVQISPLQQCKKQ